MMDKTKNILKEMLIEPVKHYLGDSGAIYGYQYNKNQKQGIQTGKQKVSFFIDDNNKETELAPIVPIFDLFNFNLEYTDICKELEMQINNIFDIEDYIREDNNVFEKHDYSNAVKYTYNNPDKLYSQDFQYIYFLYNNEDYICISIHNGCDARVGFTKPHIFKLIDIDSFIDDGNICFISCDCGKNDYNYTIYNDIFDYKNKTDITEKDMNKQLYENTYKDENGDLRCKHCNSLITCKALDY